MQNRGIEGQTRSAVDSSWLSADTWRHAEASQLLAKPHRAGARLYSAVTSRNPMPTAAPLPPASKTQRGQ